VFAFASAAQPLLYFWRNGSLTTKTMNSTSSVAAAGNFIIYTTPPNGLYRQDVSNGAEVLVSSSSGSDANSVSENGDVAYRNSSNDIVRFRDGTNTIISDNPVDWWNNFPLTDGTNIVFFRLQTGVSDIMLFDGTALNFLASTPTTTGIQVSPHYDYEVNAGWTAFTKVDASGFAQVWTRSPSGVLRAVSTFATSSRIRALGTDGSVVFDTGVDRYLASATGSPTRISGANGSVVWRSAHFIMMLGNEAFTVSP